MTTDAVDWMSVSPESPCGPLPPSVVAFGDTLFWEVPYFVVYNKYPYFSLKDLSKNVCIIHGKIR